MTDHNSRSTLPWKRHLTYNTVAALMHFAQRSDGTVNPYLLKLQDLFKVRPRSSESIRVSDVTVDGSLNLWFRQFVPTQVPTDSKLPVLIFFHGGGFTFFSPDVTQYDMTCRIFAGSFQAVVLSVNYRVTPGHKFPAQYDDGFNVLKFLEQKSGGDTELSAAADLSRCFLAGDSAGGNIAHTVARRYAESSEPAFTKLKILGLIAIQPFFGGEERTESEIRLKHLPMVSMDTLDWYWQAFLPEGEDRDHEACNVFGPSSMDISDLDKFPNTLVFVGGMDPLQDWQRRYYLGMKRSGKNARLVEYPNAIHGFYGFPELPESSLLRKEISDFISNNGNVSNG